MNIDENIYNSMKNIIFIELCNFVDYPLGGHLTFAKHLAYAMQGDLDLVGISTVVSEPLRQWYYKDIEGFRYRLYNVSWIDRNITKPLVPARITSFFHFRKCIKELQLEKYEHFVVQTPEILLALPKKYLPKVLLVMPGVSNPLSISRYPYAKKFAAFYDKIFFKWASHVKILLAAADKKAISEFVERSKGVIVLEKVVQFPTRYDGNIFKLKDKCFLRNKYQIASNECMIVTTGRLNWFKGWKLMLDAFSIFEKKHPNSCFYFIGNGEDKERIISYIEEKKLSGKVKLLGYLSLDVIADYLNMADLFVMGSFKEGWSTSLVEAVSCGAKCVVTAFSSAEEMVENGHNGFVLKDRNESLFAESMSKALLLPLENVQEASLKIRRLAVQNLKEDFLKHLNG